MWPEAIKSWRGSAEVYLDGDKVADVRLSLTEWFDMEPLTAAKLSGRLKARIVWNGTLDGLSEADQRRVVGREIELHLSNGHIAAAVFPRLGLSYIIGIGATPFELA